MYTQELGHNVFVLQGEESSMRTEVPTLFELPGTFTILTQCCGCRYRMAAPGGRADFKMAVVAYFQSHNGDHCAVVTAVAKQFFV